MSELSNKYDDYFSYTYTSEDGEQSYHADYLPYDVIEGLMAEDIDMMDWDARKVVDVVHKGILRKCKWTDKGFVVGNENDSVYLYGSKRRIRTMFYFLLTGTYPSKRWQLVLPKDNRLSIEIEQLGLRDKREDTRKSTIAYLERVKRGDT